MNTSNRIPIVRNEAYTIYGRIVSPGGKLGRYEVVAEHEATERHEYASYAEAEKKAAEIQYHFNNKNKNQAK